MDYKFCTMTHFFSNVSIYVLLCFLLSIPLSNALAQASRRFQCGVLTSPAPSPSSTQLSRTQCGPVTPPLCCLKFFPDLLLRAVVSGVERWHPRPEQGHPLGRRGQSYDFHSFFFFFYLEKALPRFDIRFDLSDNRVCVRPSCDCEHGGGIMSREQDFYRWELPLATHVPSSLPECSKQF